MLVREEPFKKNKQARFTVFSFAMSAVLFSQTVLADSLSGAVHKSIETHPAVLASKASLRGADASVEAAGSNFLPSIDLRADGGYQYAENSSTRALGSNGEDTTRRAAELKLTQRLFDGYETRYQEMSAKESAKAASAEITNSQETVAVRAIRAYLQVWRANKVIGLAEENVAKHEKILKDLKVKGRVQSNEGDIKQTTSRLSLAKKRLRDYQRELKDAEASYAEAVGEMPGSLEKPEKTSWNLPDNSAQAVEVALSNNAELTAASARVSSETASAKQADAAFMPSVNLELTESRTWDAGGIEENNIDRQAVIVLRHNFYRGGGDNARKKQAVEAKNEAMQRHDEIYRQVQRQARLDFNALDAATLNLNDLKDRADALESAVDAYRKAFGIGQRSLLDVLDVENELFQAKVAYEDGSLEHTFAQYQLLATTGQLLESFQTR